MERFDKRRLEPAKIVALQNSQKRTGEAASRDVSEQKIPISRARTGEARELRPVDFLPLPNDLEEPPIDFDFVEFSNDHGSVFLQEHSVSTTRLSAKGAGTSRKVVQIRCA